MQVKLITKKIFFIFKYLTQDCLNCLNMPVRALILLVCYIMVTPV